MIPTNTFAYVCICNVALVAGVIFHATPSVSIPLVLKSCKEWSNYTGYSQIFLLIVMNVTLVGFIFQPLLLFL